MLPAIACALAAVPLMFAEYRDAKLLRSLTKFVASASFLVYAFTLGDYTNWHHHRTITAGLWFGFVGDMLLLSRHKTWFTVGIAAFLVNHVLYIVSFSLMGMAPVGLLYGLPPCALAGWKIWRWMQPHLPADMRLPVAVYTVVLGLMVNASLGALLWDPTPARYALVLAAVMFVVSDLFVARDRFMKHDHLNMAFNVPLYFAAQLLFAHFGCSAW